MACGKHGLPDDGFRGESLLCVQNSGNIWIGALVTVMKLKLIENSISNNKQKNLKKPVCEVMGNQHGKPFMENVKTDY